MVLEEASASDENAERGRQMCEGDGGRCDGSSAIDHRRTTTFAEFFGQAGCPTCDPVALRVSSPPGGPREPPRRPSRSAHPEHPEHHAQPAQVKRQLGHRGN
jgi:hypothetical protein